MSGKNNNNYIVVCSLISSVFLLWWLPYFLKGWLPLAEWGYGLIWGDWLADRFWMVVNHVMPEWNPGNVLGVNYIGRDPFNNPLSLGNILKFVIGEPKAEWISAIFINMLVLGLGTYRFLLCQNIEKRFAVLGAVLITFYPKWMEDVGHGPGKFVTGYSVVPWAMLLICRMFENMPKPIHFVILGITGAVIFLGSGAWVSLLLSYFLVPFFIYKAFAYFSKGSEDSLKAISRVALGSVLAVIIALCLSAYLLLPLLDNLRLSSRSLYSPPAGYGLKDLAGLFFPWLSRIYTAGIYDRPLPFPVIGLISNIRFYFGILAIPLLIYIIRNKKLRASYRFFWIWPFAVILLFSKLANKFFPIAAKMEAMFGAQSSENFMFFPMIFCFNVIVAACLNDLSLGKKEFLGRGAPKEFKITNAVAKGLLYFYCLVIFLWLLVWFLMHNSPVLLNRFIALPLFSELKNYLFFQIAAYSYFYDKFFMLFLISFCIRASILWWFVSGRFVRKKIGLVVLGALMAFDFSLFPRLYYAFDPSLDLRYSGALEQNNFISNNVTALERVASFHPTQKLSFKSRRYMEFAKSRYGQERKWSPVKVFNDYVDFNPDGGYYEPLFDIALSYYPVTVGRQSYNYHESFFPEYFYDFDKAMNDRDSNYNRQSWIALWDPGSHLVDIAGISYIFWFEPLNDGRFSLVDTYSIGRGYIYKNNQAVPKAYLVKNLEYSRNREFLLSRMKDFSFNPLNTAITEDAELMNIFIPEKDNPGGGSVKISKYSANTISLDIDAKGKSLLVVTDLFFPYWTATIDGRPAKIYRVNCVFRGMVVDKNDKKIVMQYRNPMFRMGIVVSLSALFFTIMFIVSSFAARKRKGKE